MCNSWWVLLSTFTWTLWKELRSKVRKNMTHKHQIHPNPRDSIGLLQTLSKALHHLLHQGLGDKKRQIVESSRVTCHVTHQITSPSWEPHTRSWTRPSQRSHPWDVKHRQILSRPWRHRCLGGTTTTEPTPATASTFLAFKRNWFITFKIVNMATLVFPLPVGAHTWSNSLRFPQNTPTKRTIGNLRTARCFLLKLRTNIFSVCSSKAHLYTSNRRVSDWSCTIKQCLSISHMLLRLTLHRVELGGTWEGLLAPGGQFGPRNWCK